MLQSSKRERTGTILECSAFAVRSVCTCSNRISCSRLMTDLNLIPLQNRQLNRISIHSVQFLQQSYWKISVTAFCWNAIDHRLDHIQNITLHAATPFVEISCNHRCINRWQVENSIKWPRKSFFKHMRSIDNYHTSTKYYLGFSWKGTWDRVSKSNFQLAKTHYSDNSVIFWSTKEESSRYSLSSDPCDLKIDNVNIIWQTILDSSISLVPLALVKLIRCLQGI